jgi:Ankyrin repeats (many copies)
MPFYPCFNVTPPNPRHCPSSFYINKLLTISHLSYSSFVLDSFPLTKWFLENGADPNLGPDSYPPYTDKSAMVPNSKRVFEWAARSNPATAISVMNLLRHHGLRHEGSIPLHFASSRLSPQYYEQHKTPDSIFRVEDEVDIDPPYDPSSSRVPVLRYLLDLGFDPNASDIPRLGPRACGPPLHYAVRAGSVENARFLLQNGADPWAKNTNGRTALEAARYGHDPKREVVMQKLIREFM